MGILGGDGMIFYLLVVVGAIMVYGAGKILQLLKYENKVGALVGLKLAGLGLALIGILKLLNIY
jgi:hypothetical protein